MKRRLCTSLLLLIIAMAAVAQSPKYVFYFIGDGMGPSHVLGTELYINELQGNIGRNEKLSFTQFPHTAFVTTFSASNGVTDSAASGTALATGNKTYNGAIGITADGTPCSSVAQWAKEAGYAVGISTTVPINHATPSAFYAHQKSRNNYDEIAQEMHLYGFDFFAGGDPVYNNGDRNELYKQYKKSDYTIARGIKQFDAMYKKADKMMLFQSEVLTQLPYSIDQDENDLNLAQITKAGIEFLTGKSDKGFFFMIEGGKIDYASHDDDAATMIKEVQDFDRAIKVALDFYNEHSDETLIVVTADHETGGLVLGFKGSYTLNLKALAGQKVSEDELENILIAANSERLLTWEETKELLTQKMGLWNEVSVEEKQAERLKAMNEETWASDNKDECNKWLRNIADYAKFIVSYSASISWASGNHSGTFVPLFAIGIGAEKFHGIIDNTDVPKTISNIAGYR